jgi:hypothetical protein
MSFGKLDADYYRLQALLCYRLANEARAAKPLFSRLYHLAKAYDEKAKSTDPALAGGQAPGSPNQPTSPRSMPRTP